MKKLCKSIVATILIAILAVSAFGANTAQAATKKMPFKVTIGDESYTFTKDVKKKVKKVSIKKVKKAFGKPSSKDSYGWYWDAENYILTCGKKPSSIEFTIMGKNASLSGFKIGMSKKSVIKKLKTYGIKESDLVTTEYEFPECSVIDVPLYDDDNFIRFMFDGNDKAGQIFIRIHPGSVK